MSLIDSMMKMMASKPMIPTEGRTREEKIALFNRAADEITGTGTNFYHHNSTKDFTRKSQGGARIPFESLHAITIADLEVGKTHRGRVVYCRIATRVMMSVSAMVLVEDDSALTGLAVYGITNPKELKDGRLLAIKEPFYKIRADGSKGIRVDDPADIVFDAEKSSEPAKETFKAKRVSAEERLQELLCADGGMGVNKLYRALLDEGYSISKKQVRALKKSCLMTAPEVKEAKVLIPILSERRPEKHRVLHAPKVLECRDAGNKAFKDGDFEQAEKLYSEALKHKEDLSGNSGEEVHLWQLYSNRSAARMKLGMLNESFQDSLVSNICAPSDAVEPLLRCAEAMCSLGLCEEANNLLSAATAEFSSERDQLENKKRDITPKHTLRVGKNAEFTTISEALRRAPAGAEVLVDAGVYCEPLFLNKPVTLRCVAANDYDAIQSLEGNIQGSWAEIRVSGAFAITCQTSSMSDPIHIIGFKIMCDASPHLSFHATYVSGGVVVLRNCVVSCSSGPVIAAQSPKTRLILQACAVHGGAQGGILAIDGAVISLQQVHCCRHKASGLELRARGTAFLEGCHFYKALWFGKKLVG